MFAVEVLKAAPVGSEAPLSSPFYTLDEDVGVPGARVYDLVIPPGQSTGLHTWHFFATCLSLSDAALDVQLERKNGRQCVNPFDDKGLQTNGSYKWVQGPLALSISNRGQEPYKAVFIEWLQEVPSAQ